MPARCHQRHCSRSVPGRSVHRRMAEPRRLSFGHVPRAEEPRWRSGLLRGRVLAARRVAGSPRSGGLVTCQTCGQRTSNRPALCDGCRAERADPTTDSPLRRGEDPWLSGSNRRFKPDPRPRTVSASTVVKCRIAPSRPPRCRRRRRVPVPPPPSYVPRRERRALPHPTPSPQRPMRCSTRARLRAGPGTWQRAAADAPPNPLTADCPCLFFSSDFSIRLSSQSSPQSQAPGPGLTHVESGAEAHQRPIDGLPEPSGQVPVQSPQQRPNQRPLVDAGPHHTPSSRTHPPGAPVRKERESLFFRSATSQRPADGGAAPPLTPRAPFELHGLNRMHPPVIRLHTQSLRGPSGEGLTQRKGRDGPYEL